MIVQGQNLNRLLDLSLKWTCTPRALLRARRTVIFAELFIERLQSVSNLLNNSKLTKELVLLRIFIRLNKTFGVKT